MTLFNKDNRYSNCALLFVILCIGYLVFRELPINVFSYDVLGYYLYLPATFKYKDLALSNYDKLQSVLSTYGTSEGFYQAFQVSNGNWVMKYPMGMSILYSPFYFIGDLIASNTKSFPSDGFSRPYQLSVLYGCYLYTVLGLIAFRKVLLSFFTDKITALVILLIVFGTNYILHVSIHAQPAMSHNLLFALHAFTLLYTIKWHSTRNFKYLIGLAFTIGITAITRPPEALIILIPIFYEVSNFKSLRDKVSLFFQTNRWQIIVCVVLIIISCQLVYWKVITGKFIFDGYSNNLGEGFNFLRPYILEFLFSFRKGWLIYTPLSLFALVGFYLLYKERKDLFIPFFSYFILIFYISASWSCWWYGTSFSSRAIIPAYAVLAIPFGYALKKMFNTRLKMVFIPIALALVSLNLFQSWQASKGILNGSRMTGAYYNSVFFQTDSPTPDQDKLLLMDKYSAAADDFDENMFLHLKKVYESKLDFESGQNHSPRIISSKLISYTKPHSLLVDSIYPYGLDISKVYKEITKKSYLWIKASAQIYINADLSNVSAGLVITMRHKNKVYKYNMLDIKKANIKRGKWSYIEYYYLTPDFWDKKDKIQTFFWNGSNKSIFVDDLKIEAYEPLIDETVF